MTEYMVIIPIAFAIFTVLGGLNDLINHFFRTPWNK